MATKPAEELAAGALKYQTWVLKVSIHCEGCRREVKKVLQSVEGVYHITIDPQQHKVTVTGNVEADTLLKKLLKSNKHAELWPEPKNSKKKKSKKNKEKGEADGENADEAKDQQADENGIGGDDDDDDDDEGEAEKEAGNQTNEGAVSAGGASTGAKKKKKKKKKKGPSGNPPNGGAGTTGDQHHSDAHPAGANAPLMVGQDMSQPNFCSPIQHMYPGPYPAPMYYQPPAEYGLSNLSYNTMYPSSSASYITPAMHDSTYYEPDIYSPIDTIVDPYTDDDDEIGCYIM